MCLTSLASRPVFSFNMLKHKMTNQHLQYGSNRYLQHHDTIGNYLGKSINQAKPGEHGDVLSGHHLVDCLVSCCARKFYLEQTKYDDLMIWCWFYDKKISSFGWLLGKLLRAPVLPVNVNKMRKKYDDFNVDNVVLIFHQSPGRLLRGRALNMAS